MIQGFQIEHLRRAHSAWRAAGNEADDSGLDHPLSEAEALELLNRAAHLLTSPRSPGASDADAVLLVAKAPHAGSSESMTQIIARCLAFGLHVSAVSRLPASEATTIAHALYPDVWTSYARPPASTEIWSRLSELFDRPEFVELFGTPYAPAMVKQAERVATENGLTAEQLAVIWQEGRVPLARQQAQERYGGASVERLFGESETFDWYRCDLPIGIQKLASSTMAFALRHNDVYDGAPTIVVNGQFTLLSRLFSDELHGTLVVELALPPSRSVTDFRRLLVGHSDVPQGCLPGSIRRDALDGYITTDTATKPTPWANMVHASDGYLSGTIETRRLVPKAPPSRLELELRARGYTSFEIDELVLADPVTKMRHAAGRLTSHTKGARYDLCLAEILRLMPSQRSLGNQDEEVEMLRGLLGLVCAPAPDDLAEAAHPIAGRMPATGVPRRSDIATEIHAAGVGAVARGAVGVTAPLAGSGGRFGGYEAPEGSPARMKPLLPLFEIAGRPASALDVRAAHLRALQAEHGTTVPLFVSCSRHSEASVADWARSNSDLIVDIGRVPELFRVRAREAGAGGYESTWEAVSALIRDDDGNPQTKPVGSLGMLLALARSGVLHRWIATGIEYVVTGNADDVGLRIDPAVLGLFETQPNLDAVVLALRPEGFLHKGGAIMDRPKGNGEVTRYVEENADLAASSTILLNSNQIYFRAASLERAIRETGHPSSGVMLPRYLENKALQLSNESMRAWHTYRPYCDVLRLLDRVEAIEIAVRPGPDQRNSYSPLKTGDDVLRAQATLDSLAALGDQLPLPHQTPPQHAPSRTTHRGAPEAWG